MKRWISGAWVEQGTPGGGGGGGSANVVNTDGDPGDTIYVGTVDPSIANTLEAGDVWINPDDLSGAYYSGGKELDYVESAAFFTMTGLSATDVTGFLISPIIGSRPVYLGVDLVLQSGTSGAVQAFVSIYEGATQIIEWQISLLTQFALVPFKREVRVSPSAGSHSYQLKLRTGNAAHVVSFPATTTANYWMNAIER